MNASYRRGQQNIRDRRAAAKGDTRKSLISKHVSRVVADKAARKGVTAGLQKAAKPLRESGELGQVRTRVCAVAEGVRGRTHRYTPAQLARIAAEYNPRKAEYKAARTALLAV